MKLSLPHSLAALALAALSAPALAQSDIDPGNKYAWGENIGFTNWRDAGNPASSQGVVVHASFLSGFVWGENVGWINLGNGAPTSNCAGLPCYSNTIGPETGVNLDAVTGNLSGLAWGENIGWINFSGGAMATPPIPARFDPVGRRFRGYVWGANIGWINLDHAVVFVAVLCPADVNGDGFVDGLDSDQFNNAFEAGDLSADFNGDGFVDGLDSDDFNNAFEAGC